MLPDSCLVYLNTTHFFDLNKKINSQSLIADKLKLFDDVNTLCSTIRVFDSLFNSYDVLKEEIEDNLIHFALYKNHNWLVTFNIKQLGKQASVMEALSKILNAKKIKEKTYEFELNKRDTYYLNLNAGVAIISPTKDLIDLSLNSSRSKFENSDSFKEFKNTLSENNLLSIYVNHQLYTGNTIQNKLDLSSVCKKGFSVGSIDFQPSQVKINGYLDADSSEILSAFLKQEAQSPETVLNCLPLNTISFKAYGFSYYPDLQNTLNKKITSENAMFWKAANDLALYNLQSDFYVNTENTLVSFVTVPSKQVVIALGVTDTIKTLEHLKLMSDSILKEDSLFVYQLRKVSTPSKLFSPLFNTPTNYVMLYNSYLFFAENKKELIQTINSLRNNLLLTNNESFVPYKNQYFIDDFNYLVYNSPNQLTEEIPDFFNFKTSSKEDPFENFKHFSFSVTSNTKNFKFRFHLLNETKNLDKEQNVLWTLKLDSASVMKAGGFINHITKENEIVVQDNGKNLYLINAKGTILWKKKLNEPVFSDIHVVDIFKNNKYQLLFNTRNYLHLIDRNGNYVDGYPVKLPAEASSELSVFDYDGDKDYRLFIACKNNSIYNFSIYGIKQEKFTTVKTESEVNLPVHYIKVGTSDYLVALDNEGKIYTFSRKGVGRIGLRNRTIANCSAFYVDVSNTINSTYLVYVDDKSGLLNKISFADKKEIVKLNSDIENASVDFELVDDNRSMDLILTKNNSILAYNFSGNLIEEKTTEINLSRSSFYNDESHSLLYSLSTEQSELVLFDQLKQKTQTLKATSMPLISNLFNDNKKYLIFSNGRQLNCVLLN